MAQSQWSGTPGTNPVDTGEMWECPDFFPLGNKHVFIYSTQGKTIWQSGTLDRKTLLFHVERTGQLDYGHRTYYAPKTQLDAHGNRILWGWVSETRHEPEISLRERLPAQAGMHVFIDNSVIEIFIDSRYCVTHRFYTRTPGKSTVTLTIAGQCRITRPQSFSLHSVWPS